MGPLRSGPMCGTDELGQYKTPDMPGSIRAQRVRAPSVDERSAKVLIKQPCIDVLRVALQQKHFILRSRIQTNPCQGLFYWIAIKRYKK